MSIFKIYNFILKGYYKSRTNEIKRYSVTFIEAYLCNLINFIVLSRKIKKKSISRVKETKIFSQEIPLVGGDHFPLGMCLFSLFFFKGYMISKLHKTSQYKMLQY